MDNFSLFALALGGLLTMTAALRDVKLEQDTCLLAGVWIICSAFVDLTKVYEPWHFSILVDGLAVYWLLWPAKGKRRAALAALFCIQIAMHISYGIAEALAGQAAYAEYYEAVGFIGWMQLFFVGGAGIAQMVRGLPVPRWHLASRRVRKKALGGGNVS